MEENLKILVMPNNGKSRGTHSKISIGIQNRLYKKNKFLTTNIVFAFDDWMGCQTEFGPWIKAEDPIAANKNELVRETIKKIRLAYLKLKEMTGEEPTPEDIIKMYKGERPKALNDPKIVEFITDYMKSNPNMSDHSRRNFASLLKVLGLFLKNKHGLDDYSIRKIDMTFIYRFEMYLAGSTTKWKKAFGPKTIELYIKKFKAVLRYAYKIGEIKQDPTVGHKIQEAPAPQVAIAQMKEAIFWKIDPEQLRKVESVNVDSVKIKGDAEFSGGTNQHMYDLGRTRLLFLLQTWTGMAYADLEKMKDVRPYITVDLCNRKCILYYRQKTGQLAVVPLFAQTVDLLEALQYNASPQGSYDTYRRKIRALMAAYNISLEEEKSATHLGRHLFGSRMLLMGYSMESISLMMGHSSIRETEKVYARIDMHKINAEYDRIKETISHIGTKIAV